MTRAKTGTRHLLLMRHASADAAANDHARPLTPRGREEAARMGQKIAALTARAEDGVVADRMTARAGDGVAADRMTARAVEVTRVLCSSARRTRETWREMRDALAGAAKVEVRDALYAASARELLAAVQQCANSERAVLVIAHEPAISNLVALLTARAGSQAAQNFQRGMRPASCAVFAIPEPGFQTLTPGSAELLHFLLP